jgi:hypothetical protein
VLLLMDERYRVGKDELALLSGDGGDGRNRSGSEVRKLVAARVSWRGCGAGLGKEKEEK